jgi:hypothetical protein
VGDIDPSIGRSYDFLIVDIHVGRSRSSLFFFFYWWFCIVNDMDHFDYE